MTTQSDEYQNPDGFTAPLPTYEQVRPFLKTLEEVARNDLNSLFATIRSLTGTPQENLDWSDPETWIPERLAGVTKDLAIKIWRESGGLVNPRHMNGPYRLIVRHSLLNVEPSGTFQLTERSRQFIEMDLEMISTIDRIEGLAFLLQQISVIGNSRVGDLFVDWYAFVSSRSKYSAESSIKSLLRSRLINLESRGLITRSQGRISITEEGKEYARIHDHIGADDTDELSDLMASIREYNRLQREHLQQRLSEMDPYAFEFLVRDLLEEMGYSDVSVTSQGGDFGVDVVATVEFGITTITEFVQVKRRTRTLGRKEVDQLRGALPYHGAIRGTLITLGSFSSGCESAAIFPGAQPITLIDGEKLIELVLKHEVGMKRRSVDLHEVDESYFAMANDMPEEEQDI